MSIEIVKIDARKVLPYYIPFLLLAIAYVLFRQTPLARDDWLVNLTACLQGMITAWRLFQDSSDTEAFVFSRPLSRSRLFLTRWSFGISLQLLTIFTVFAAIAIGLRSGIQTLMNSPYHPLVKWYELSVLGSVALFSILGYEVVMFLKLRRTVSGKSLPMWKKILAIGLACVACLISLSALVTGNFPDYLIATYAILVIIFGTLSSLQRYKRLEIQA